METLQPHHDDSSGSETKTSAYVKTLQAYKKLTDDPDNHQRLLKDKTVLLLIAYLLETAADEILHLCLDILFDFLVDCDPKTQEIMTSVLGLLEALHCLKSKALTQKTMQKVCLILNNLESVRQPISRYSTIAPRKYKVYNLYLPGLNKELKSKYEDSLIGIRGIVSFVIDMESNCCMLRISALQRIQDIVRNITDKTGSSPMLVIVNGNGRKEYIASCDTGDRNFDCEESESFIDAPISFFKDTLSQTKTKVQCMLDTLNTFFYW